MFFQGSGASAGVLGNASQITDVAWQSIDNLITGVVARLPFVIAGILVAVIFYVAARIAKSMFLAATKRTRLDHRLRILFSRLIVVVLIVLGIFTALTVIIPSFGFGDLIAGVGFTTFMIGFATKDILNNLLSGVLILWQQPFRIGDQIFVGNILGRVEYIGVRATSLRKDDGELVIIPNGDMYSGTLVIRGAGSKRRMNLNFKIGYDEDVDKAKASVRTALLATDGVVSDPPPNVLITELASEGVNITVNFWINTNEAKPREVFDQAATAIMRSLTRLGVEPYPPGSVIVRGFAGDRRYERQRGIKKFGWLGEMPRGLKRSRSLFIGWSTARSATAANATAAARTLARCDAANDILSGSAKQGREYPLGVVLDAVVGNKGLGPALGTYTYKRRVFGKHFEI